jgi:hypothetical protein
MQRILAIAGMVASGAGCSILQCGEGTAETTWSWKGAVPRATLIAAAPSSTAVVWDGFLSVLADDRAPVTSTLAIEAKAIAMAPDGGGIVVGRMQAQVFDPFGVPGFPFALDPLPAEAPGVVFDGYAFSIVWSIGQQVFHARVSPSGTLLKARTLIGVGAPDCPRVGPVVVAALADHSAWIAWTGGSLAEPTIVAVRLVDGAVTAPAPLPIATELTGACGTSSLRGIAASGMEALLHVEQTVIPLHANGSLGEPHDLGESPMTLIGRPQGFALVKPYDSGAFPRDLYTTMRLLELDGTEVASMHVRGASGVYAHAGDRLMAATGVDEHADDQGTSTLGVTRFYDDGQSLPVVLSEDRMENVPTTRCIPSSNSDY